MVELSYFQVILISISAIVGWEIKKNWKFIVGKIKDFYFCYRPFR